MKILVVSPLLPSPSIEMRGVRTNESLRLLRGQGHEVRAVVPIPYVPPGVRRGSWQRWREVPAIEDDHGVEIAHPRFARLGPVTRTGPGHRLQRRLFHRALAAEVAHFEAGGGDIVHAHSVTLPGVLAGRLGRAKLVVSMHDHELFESAPASHALARSIARSLRRADCAVYVSPTLQSEGRRLAGPHESRVIPLAIDAYPDIQPRPAPVFTVITAARLIARKHIDRLVDAFVRVRASVPSARLAIAGEGPERLPLERRVARAGVAADVDFLGALPNRRLVEEIARAHVFALPSVRESLGTVYFEAMSMGVPIVGTVGEGIADYVTDGVDGFLLPPEDTDGLTSLLRRLHADPERRATVGAAGRERLRQIGATWPAYVDAHVELFRELIESGGAPSS